MKNILFFDTAVDYEPDNFLTHGGLVAIAMAPGSKPEYIAMLDDLPMSKMPQLNFESWWHKTVFVDKQRRQLTREELVLTVADQDGGAHVDPSLNEKYAELSRFNSLAWMGSYNGIVQPMNGPERAAIRQVAHEVIKSLRPGYTKKPDLRCKTIFVGAKAKITDSTHMPLRTATRSTVGRNDPCPCGSGKKYKKCCGR